MLISEAQRRGLTAYNPVREVRVRLPKREQTRPEMPTAEELRAILAAASGRWRPLIVTADFHRVARLRGAGVEVGARRPRGARAAGARARRPVGQVRPAEVGGRHARHPLAPIVVNTLREWKLACPRPLRKTRGSIDPGELDLVFPNGAGKVEFHANILNRGFGPLQVALGIIVRAR